MNVLVCDVGGNNIKVLATGQDKPRKIPSGPAMTAQSMASEVKELAGEWKYDVVSIGYPGPIRQGRPVAEPHNLGRGWVGFDYERAFVRPVKLINDAAMQALGSYQGGKMLFLGLGTGLGSALVVESIVVPLELCTLPYKKGNYEDYVGTRGLVRLGKKEWRQCVADVVARFIEAFVAEDVVLGGGNVKYLKELPPGCRAGENANAFLGGFRLWEDVGARKPFALVKARGSEPLVGTPNEMNTNMTAGIQSITARSGWKALKSHYEKIRELHLRELFADDPKRGERLSTEAVGLYLDYSKNRVTEETLKLLVQLAEECDLRGRIDAMFRGEKINITENRAVLHVALRAPRGASIFVDGEDV
ncbi:MAG TPA: hypothetical protein VHS80_01645, partial [Chthoniobacterales bacterium]|nr:hypothetical protein [Chthoniobacterales bacterium]